MSFSTQKNPPWARTNDFGALQQSTPNMQQPVMNQTINPAVLQYPQSAVANTQPSMYQAQLAMQQQALSMQQFVTNNTQQLYNPQVSGLAQTARAVNPGATMMPTNVMMQQNTVSQPSPHQQDSSVLSRGAPSKQRVFTGTVTKVVDTYGFVDEDVFFQMSCVKGPHPVLRDRVLVEAVCLPTMPFKWNATRVQVLPMSDAGGNRKPPASRYERGAFSAVPPPSEMDNRRERDREREREREQRERERERDRDRERERDRERDRERERDKDRDRDRRSDPKETSIESEERRRRRERRDRDDKEREKESRGRSRSRSRSRSPRRRTMAAQRKQRMRVPEFPLDMKLLNVSLAKSRYPTMYIPSDFFCARIRWSDIAPKLNPLSIAGPSRFHIMDKDVDPVFQFNDVVEPPDADFRFSAKVILLSIPDKEQLYKRCIQLSEDKENSRLTHPTRLIDCLVGVYSRAKNDYMAIGGPWSPSLDGEDPEGDPQVLIKTAIRTCKALTNIDLSKVTRWYRFVEIHYNRAKSSYKGQEMQQHVETVVVYAPDVWSVMPSGLEWDGLHLNYQKALDRKLAEVSGESVAEETAAAEDEKEDAAAVTVKEPTHWSKIDLKTMKVTELREEFVARNLSPKGLKLQLIARMTKVLKQEQEAEEEKAKQNMEVEKQQEKKDEEKKLKEKEVQEKDKNKDFKEKDRATLMEKYKLPETPHIIVHPCRKAKNGKFGCKVVSLSSVLNYSEDVSKEHAFEVALFAENVNEMFMRDFGMQIFKSLVHAPDKEEEKEKKDKNEETEKNNKREDKEKASKSEDKEKKEKVEDKEKTSKSEDKEKKEKVEDKEKTMKNEDKEKKEKVEDKEKKEQVDEKEKKDPVNEKEKKEGSEEKEKVEKSNEKEKTSDVKEKDGSVERKKKDQEGDEDESRDATDDSKEKINGQDDEDKKKRGKRSEKKKEKFRSIRPDLLLAFSYFDVTQFGKISNSDLEDLIQTLGLDLARSQVKRLVNKISDESFLNYRKLTDEPIKEGETATEAPQTPKIAESEQPEPCELGNKSSLPNFVLTPPPPLKGSPSKRKRNENENNMEATSEDTGLIYYKGSMLNIENLQVQVEKNEAARLRAEEKAVDLKRDAVELKEKLDHSKSELRSTRKEVSNLQKKLDAITDKLAKEQVSSDIYLTTMMDIQERLIPILDTDEIKRLIRLRQEMIGTPSINLVSLSKLSDIVAEEETKPETKKVKGEDGTKPEIKRKGEEDTKPDTKRKGDEDAKPEAKKIKLEGS